MNTMATPVQVKANRRNAKRSTGPKTATGKAIASRNATTHGLLARDLVLQGDDAQLFQDRRDALRRDLRPMGALEGDVVDQIATCAWRLRRLPHIEAGLFRYGSFAPDATRLAALADQCLDRTAPLDAVYTSVQTSTDERGHAAAPMHEAPAAKAQETLAIAFANQSHNFEKLSRYETSIARRFRAAVHDLLRLQAARREREAAELKVSGMGASLKRWQRQVEQRRAAKGDD